jgi:16S rRNA processing protein RimM
VGRPHGLDGHFHVAEPRPQLLRVGVTVVVGGAETSIVSLKGTDDRPVVRLEAAGDRTAVEALRGASLDVPDAEVPALDEDEYWAEQLEGCVVADGEVRLGEVRRLLALPSCEVLELDDGTLVPLVRDAIRSIDVRAKRIEVDRGFLGAA